MDKDQKERVRYDVEEALKDLLAYAAVGFILATLVIMTCCGHIRLPDRTKCVTPWEERKDCISDRQCSYDQLCAKRGRVIGKCTLIDCCDPWCGQPGIKSGYDWCTQTELDKDTETRYTY